MCRWNGKTLIRREIDLTIESDASLIDGGQPAKVRGPGGPGQNRKPRCTRTAGSDTGSSNICQKRDRCHYPADDRQYLHQQPGGHSLPGSGELSQGPLDVAPREKHTHYSPTPPWAVQSSGRCGVTHNEGPHRLEPEPSPVPEDRPTIQPNRSRSVCIQNHSTVPSLLQLAARSLCSRDRCIPSGLVTQKGVCESPMVSNRQSPSTDSDPTGSGDTSCLSMENATMVPITPDNLVDLPRLVQQSTWMTTRLVEPMLSPQLAMWPISGRDTETKSFQRKLPHYSSGPDGLKQTNPMTHFSTSGTTGAIGGIQIPFLAP